jgi:hypothetical protein
MPRKLPRKKTLALVIIIYSHESLLHACTAFLSIKMDPIVLQFIPLQISPLLFLSHHSHSANKNLQAILNIELCKSVSCHLFQYQLTHPIVNLIAVFSPFLPSKHLISCSPGWETTLL